jgi:soluble P-type ATPase
VNRTIAFNGRLIAGVDVRLEKPSQALEPWLIGADTQGTLASLGASLKVTALWLESENIVAQKAARVDELGAARVVNIGNGANDEAMLRQAALGIAVLGGEGLAVVCLDAADVIAPNIEVVLNLLLYPRRSIATLRT